LTHCDDPPESEAIWRGFASHILRRPAAANVRRPPPFRGTNPADGRSELARSRLVARTIQTQPHRPRSRLLRGASRPTPGRYDQSSSWSDGRTRKRAPLCEPFLAQTTPSTSAKAAFIPSSAVDDRFVRLWDAGPRATAPGPGGSTHAQLAAIFGGRPGRSAKGLRPRYEIPRPLFERFKRSVWPLSRISCRTSDNTRDGIRLTSSGFQPTSCRTPACRPHLHSPPAAEKKSIRPALDLVRFHPENMVAPADRRPEAVCRRYLNADVRPRFGAGVHLMPASSPVAPPVATISATTGDKG